MMELSKTPTVDEPAQVVRYGCCQTRRRDRLAEDEGHENRNPEEDASNKSLLHT